MRRAAFPFELNFAVAVLESSLGAFVDWGEVDGPRFIREDSIRIVDVDLLGLCKLSHRNIETCRHLNGVCPTPLNISLLLRCVNSLGYWEAVKAR